MAELARVQVPVLVVGGTTDLQASVDHAHRLAATRPGTEVVLVDGMNHVLKGAPLERTANIAINRDPDLPLAPELKAALARFLHR